MIKSDNKNKALTLIESLIWFAVFAAVMVGVFALYSNSRDANNTATVNKEMATFFSRSNDVFSNESPASLSNDMAVKFGLFPNSLKNTGSGINNVFGGTVTTYGVAPSSIYLLYTNIPAGSICSNIVKAQKSVGWNAVQVNSTPILYVFDESTASYGYSITNATNACSNKDKSVVTLILVR